MASSAFPVVIGAVVTVARATVTGARVVRGRDISDGQDDVVMVGVRDAEASSFDSAGTFEQSMQSFGGNREEVGTVYGLVSSFDGGGNQDTALGRALDHLAGLEARVRADPTLGLTSFEYVVAQMHSGDVAEAQTDLGAISVLSFSIDYKVRI